MQQLADIGQDILPAYTRQDLKAKQQEDADLARAMSFVGCPEENEQNKLLKQWDKLSVCRNLISGENRLSEAATMTQGIRARVECFTSHVSGSSGSTYGRT